MHTLKEVDLTRDVITLEPNKTLYDARNSLLMYNISRIVLAKDNKSLGILTEKDILSDAYFNRYQSETPKGQGTTNEYTDERVVSTKTQKRYPKHVPSGIKSIFLGREVMTYDPITISKDSDLDNAARIMSRNNISGIPIVGSARDWNCYEKRYSQSGCRKLAKSRMIILN